MMCQQIIFRRGIGPTLRFHVSAGSIVALVAVSQIDGHGADLLTYHVHDMFVHVYLSSCGSPFDCIKSP